MVKILGVDEAGRGPVIGNLVIAGTLIEEKNISKLIDLGVKDSKLISPRNRELMYKKIISIVEDYEILIVTPEEIDEAVLSEEMNLNKLEAIKTAMLINKFNPDKAIIDCPSTNIESYKEYLRTFLKNKKVELILEHKADLNFPIVSAASILAKVTRDKSIEELKKKYGEIGSGYPADPLTQKFVRESLEYHPEIFRKSWATIKNLEKDKKQNKLTRFSK